MFLFLKLGQFGTVVFLPYKLSFRENHSVKREKEVNRGAKQSKLKRQRENMPWIPGNILVLGAVF